MGHVSTDALADARLQLHWAAQAVGALGLTYGVEVPDFSHMSLVWDEDLEALISRVRVDAHPVHGTLRPADLSLAVGPANPEVFKLDGRTLNEAYDWLEKSVATRLNRPVASLRRFEHDLPDHSVGRGGPFARQPAEAFNLLHRMYREAFELLERIRSESSSATPVRCWPHHFDVATLVQIDSADRGEEARSIGVGLSPGDGSYADPYWYVSPWPYPEPDRLPALGVGQWHLEGWIGAVLPASEWLDLEKRDGRRQVILEFLRSAVRASRSVLGDPRN